jgi:unsaturated rhamnogalacturonyl hydrolase
MQVTYVTGLTIAAVLLAACKDDSEGKNSGGAGTGDKSPAGGNGNLSTGGSAGSTSSPTAGEEAPAGKGSGGSSGTGTPSTGGAPDLGGSNSTGGVAGGASAGGGSSGEGGSGGNPGDNTATLAVQFADMVIKRWQDPRTITGATRQWDYNNGIVLRGILEVFKKTQDVRYREYIKKYVDYFVDADGNLYSESAKTSLLKNKTYSLDLIEPAILLLFLSEQFPEDTRYQTAAAGVRDMFASFPTNGDGGFWHKQSYPNEMWLDSIYMAEPFLVKYGSKNASCGDYCNDTPVAQATLLASHVRLDSGLMRHGWDFDHNAAWCVGDCAGDSGTGLSPEVWSRGLGWYSAALVDILEYLPETHAGRANLLSLLQGIASGVRDTQNATGLWCQVVDKCDLADNWTESSGTGLLIYAIKSGVDRGYLDPSYLSVAQKAWDGLKANKIGSDSFGPTINEAATGMGVQPSYASYVGIEKVPNSYHGLCAVLLAAAAIEY